MSISRLSAMIRTARLLGIVLSVLGAIVMMAPAEARDRSRPKYESLDSGPYYLQLERIVVTKIQDNAVHKLLTYILVVEFADPEARDRAKLIMPKLVNAFMRDLHILTSRPGTPEDGVDLTVAKRYLMASSVRILGADAVKDVLIERTIARTTG
jgi:hypothetical protein